MTHEARLPCRFFISLALATGLLAGCAGSPSNPELFILDDEIPTAHETGQAEDTPRLVVGSIYLADYLDQDGLVYQTAPHRIALANDNRWASPLTKQLDGILFKSLTAHIPHVEVEKGRGKKRHYYRLKTHVDQFMGHYDGRAHIKGYWQLMDPDGKTVARKAFRKTIALRQDGYPALVDSLSKGWVETSRTIADDIRSSIDTSTSDRKR